MKVLHYQRRKRAHANFSLEFIFQDVRERLAGKCEIDCRHAPYFSNGVLRRLAIIADVRAHQQQVTHVTGDINFAVLGARRDTAVVTILDCGFIERSQGIRRRFLKWFWLDWPVRWARKVTTISESVKLEILKYTGCDSGKIEVVPVAISDNFQRDFEQREFRRSGTRVLVLGTAPNKNVERIVSALRGQDCKLTIIGQLSSGVLNLLAKERVAFENLNSLSQLQVVEQYKRCDVVCFASTYEGFGMPILEAQAIGRPVVTSNCSSMPEVAGDSACLVDPFDVRSIALGLKRIVEDDEYRRGIVARGFENVKRFDGQAIAERYLHIYESLK